MKKDVLSLIYESLDELNTVHNLRLEKKLSTIIFGPESELDSLGLVNFIVEIESRFNEKYGTTFSLTDEKALSQKNSPFRTVESLTDYLISLHNEK
jgi:D-alanine--poly(phosphoribitol) ligase subunit 2